MVAAHLPYHEAMPIPDGVSHDRHAAATVAGLGGLCLLSPLPEEQDIRVRFGLKAKSKNGRRRAVRNAAI